MPAVGFTEKDRDELSSWLRDPAWPRGTMDISTLEGYLTALIAWPVNLTSGAWLPPIWGDTGWRIPATLDQAATFDRFVDLIAGYLQHLDATISSEPPTFTPVLSADAVIDRKPAAPEAAWAAGFRDAMQMGANGAQWISPAVRAAVDTIARQFSRPKGVSATQATREITQAVAVLVSSRASRGPLGALPVSASVKRSARETAAAAPEQVA